LALSVQPAGQDSGEQSAPSVESGGEDEETLLARALALSLLPVSALDR